MANFGEKCFLELGNAGNEGKAFAITQDGFREYFAGDVANFPKADYPHSIYYCDATDNYLVVRETDGSTRLSVAFGRDLLKVR